MRSGCQRRDGIEIEVQVTSPLIIKRDTIFPAGKERHTDLA
jgi:hypothetical protein